MKTVRLARIAAEAETLRLRHMAVRTGRRAAYAIVALIFGVALLVMVHCTAWIYAARYFGPGTASWIILGVDLVFCLIFALLASRGGPDRVEEEALQVRQTALHQIGQSFALLMLLRPVARRARRGGFLGRLLATGIEIFLRR